MSGGEPWWGFCEDCQCYVDNPIHALGHQEAREDIGTQIVITPPEGAAQILVRVPHPYEPDQIQVDYDMGNGIWVPAEHPAAPGKVEVNVG